MIRIVYMITELSIGGAQQALYRLLGQLDRTLYEPEVVCLYNGDGEVAQAIRALGIPVEDLSLKQRGVLGRIWRFLRSARQNRPQIIHSFLFHANFFGRILGRLGGIPIVICSERTMSMESEMRYRLNRWTLFLVDRVTTVSEQVSRFAIEHIGVVQKKVVTIPNGIDTDKYQLQAGVNRLKELGIPPETIILGVVSRLDPVKGVDDLLKAVKQIPDIHLLIVGNGSEKEALLNLSTELDLSSRVHWLGYRSDIPELLAEIDIYVQPSLHEGMPNTVLEAMAAGLPVVATAVGGTPEIVIDQKTGYLVQPGNVQQLVEKIGHLLNNPSLIAEMGTVGQEFVTQNFSIQKTVDATERLYRQLLSEKNVSTKN